MPGPLDGVRVIDLTSMAAGPLATSVLADQGADVLKVEPVEGGDPMRHWGTPGAGGMSAVFNTLNRGKRSLALDLRHTEGLALLERVVAGADVFVQSFRPGVAQRLGFDEPHLRNRCPELIYVSINGFGETGPLAERRAYDSVVQAMAGFASVQGETRADGRPQFVNNALCDKVTGLHVAQAVSTALFARSRGAGGQHLRVSMLDAGVGFLWPDGMQRVTWIPDPDADATPPGPRARIPSVRETADGFLAVSARRDTEFAALSQALGHEEWTRDPRFVDEAARSANAEALTEVVDGVLRERTSTEWAQRLDAQQVAFAEIRPADEVHTAPQVQANGLVIESDHPTQGRMRSPRPVVRFGEIPPELPSPAPELGQHTEEVLEALGIPSPQRRALRKAGILV